MISKPLETLEDLLKPDDSWVPNHLREEKRSPDQESEDVPFIETMQDKRTSETQHTVLVLHWSLKLSWRYFEVFFPDTSINDFCKWVTILYIC